MTSQIATEIVELCDKIGSDRLLVQGAGGNISWKENESLWIKASGKWIADVTSKISETFVQLNFDNKIAERYRQHENTKLKPVSKTQLRPSIETEFHALIPKKVICHLHEVRSISILIQRNYGIILNQIIPRELKIEVIEYAKPGHNLSEKIKKSLKISDDIQIYFLQNHGIILAADSVGEILRLLDLLKNILEPIEREFMNSVSFLKDQKIGSTLPTNNRYQKLDCTSSDYLAHQSWFTCDPQLYWCFCPDNIVFLGSKAPKVLDDRSVNQVGELSDNCLIIKNYGFFVNSSVNKSYLAQLRFLTDTLSRVQNPQNIHILDEEEVLEIENWDAEKYRKSQN